MPALRAQRRKYYRSGEMRPLPLPVSFAVLLWLTTQPAIARQPPTPITQRKINEIAASMEAVRRALIEDAKLRQPGEDLTRYLRRIALPVPGETPQGYKTRITRYLDLIASSLEAAQSGKRTPALHDTSAFNRAQWDKVTRALLILPARLRKTQAAWQRAQTKPSSGAQQSKPPAFDVELAETVGVVISADDGLRDARP